MKIKDRDDRLVEFSTGESPREGGEGVSNDHGKGKQIK